MGKGANWGIRKTGAEVQERLHFKKKKKKPDNHKNFYLETECIEQTINGELYQLEDLDSREMKKLSFLQIF